MARKIWSMDRAHSEARFKVKHMMISSVSGEFTEFESTLETDENNDFSTAKATFKAPIDSINTKMEQRDNHLKEADFFDVAHHPHLFFESTKMTQTGEGEYEMEGNLTIRETTKPVILKVDNEGVIKDGQGNWRTGFEISGQISRKAFGLQYNALTEAGGAVVGDKVRLNINMEMTRPHES